MNYSYKDVTGAVYGPFSPQQMMHWYQKKFLSEELDVIVQPDNEQPIYTKLKMLIAVHGRDQPFIGYSMTPRPMTVKSECSYDKENVTPPPNDPKPTVAIRMKQEVVEMSEETENTSSEVTRSEPVIDRNLSCKAYSEGCSEVREPEENELDPTIGTANCEKRVSIDKLVPSIRLKNTLTEENFVNTRVGREQTDEQEPSNVSLRNQNNSNNEHEDEEASNANLESHIAEFDDNFLLEEDQYILISSKSEHEISKTPAEVELVESVVNQLIDATNCLTMSESGRSTPALGNRLSENTENYENNEITESSENSPAQAQAQENSDCQTNTGTTTEESEDEDVVFLASYSPNETSRHNTPTESPPPTPVPNTNLGQSLPLLGKLADTDKFLPLQHAELKLFRLDSMIKNMPEIFWTIYPYFEDSKRQLCGICGQYLEGMKNVFEHLVSDAHMSKIEKQSLTKKDIHFWIKIVEDIFIYGRKSLQVVTNKPREKRSVNPTVQKWIENYDARSSLPDKTDIVAQNASVPSKVENLDEMYDAQLLFPVKTEVMAQPSVLAFNPLKRSAEPSYSSQTSLIEPAAFSSYPKVVLFSESMDSLYSGGKEVIAKTFGELAEGWDQFETASFDILYSYVYPERCQCGGDYPSPSLFFRHLFQNEHKSAIPYYFREDLERWKTQLEMVKSVPEWIRYLPEYHWETQILTWETKLQIEQVPEKKQRLE